MKRCFTVKKAYKNILKILKPFKTNPDKKVLKNLGVSQQFMTLTKINSFYDINIFRKISHSVQEMNFLFGEIF